MGKFRFFIFSGLFLLGTQVASAIEGEVGPLDFEASFFLTKQNSPQAFRVESYGEMQFELQLDGQGHKAPPFFVEGPLDQNGDAVPVGGGKIILRNLNSKNESQLKLPVTLPSTGVYRVVFSEGSAKIRALCQKGCYRDSIAASALLKQYRDEGKLPALLKKVQSTLDALLPSPEYSKILSKELETILDKANYQDLDHFPLIPITEFSRWRRGLEALRNPEAPPSKPDPVMQGRLEDLLGRCDVPRVGAEAIPELPENLKYGHFPNLALTACQSAHSQPLAHLLTSLSVNDPSLDASQLSWVEYRGEKFTSVSKFIEALIAGGHTIELRHERTFANFLSITVDNHTDLRWPVWLDTGLEVNGEPLRIPSGHSQHVWKISGPVVNTQVAFFLGMFGAAFQAQTDTRPAWTGRRLSFFRSTSDRFPDSKELILKTFKTAELYLQLNRKERNGLISDGYGVLGICNDSDAVLELASRGTCSAYPLVRDSNLNKLISPSDFSGLVNILRRIPDDALFGTTNRRNVLTRIFEMRPYEVNSNLWFDETLRSQMKKILTRQIHWNADAEYNDPTFNLF